MQEPRCFTHWLPIVSRRFTAAAVFLCLLFTSVPGTPNARAESVPVEMQMDRDNYYTYRQEHASAPEASQTLQLDIADAVLNNAEQLPPSDERSWEVMLKDNGFITLVFNVETAALYCLELDYMYEDNQGKEVQLYFQVDGEYPYMESRALTLKSLWRDVGGIQTDAQGNDRIPKQEEVFRWQTFLLRDFAGMSSSPLQIYLTPGRHELTLGSASGKFHIGGICLCGRSQIPSYAEKLADYTAKGLKPVDNIYLPYQAERPAEKTDQTLYPTYDRSSPVTQPYDVSKIKRNTIGQQNWASAGMAITYEVDVPADGLYLLTLKYKQSLQTDISTFRNIRVNGEIPYAELENISFPFGFEWTNKTLSDEDGSPCYIPLNKGRNTIQIEATVGSMSPVFDKVDQIIYHMNEIYRRIMMVTGAEPDTNRDYYLEREIPQLYNRLSGQAAELEETADMIRDEYGEHTSEAEKFVRIAQLLHNLAEEPSLIALRLSELRDEISTLTSWLITARSQPLELDYFIVHSADAELPRAKATFWQSLKNAVLTFLYSYVEDYSYQQPEGDRHIVVWSSDGREQVQLLKDLISDRFTPETGITVNLSLVQGGFIEATLAGRGPDVALNVARGQPVNLACRGALLDLSDFDGFNTVVERFLPQAMIPYQYQNGCYALPTTQQFFMMFYRTDIFKTLGLEPPDTWADLISLLPVLDRYHMSVGLPYAAVSALSAVDGGLGSKDIFPTLLMQMGGSFYNEEQTATGFDTPEAVEAFKMWVDFYVKRGFDLTYDFNSRFRSGEMPLGIASYQTFNLLSAAAPEIRNQWTMLPVPGVEKDDGTIDRTVGTSGTGSIIFSGAKDPEACWAFLDWWSSAEIQYQYGIGVENLLGPAGRYTPSNVEAMKRLPWSSDEWKVLERQMAFIREIPEVPGSYYVSRSIDNAFRNATYNMANPREALEKENAKINRELQRKRQELENK